MYSQSANKGQAIFLALILGMAIGIGGGCGTGADSLMNAPVPASANFYGGPFALDDIVLPSDNGQNGETVTITGTATTIQYVLNVPAQNGSAADTVILELDGEFTIPAASLAAGNVDGTIGAVQSVGLSTDFGTIFTIDGLSVDAGQLTAAWTADGADGFWSLIAGGSSDIIASSQGSATNLYCTQAGEGTPGDNFIVIPTTTTVSIRQFLQSC